MQTPLNEILRHKAVLSNFRLTETATEVEFWEYKRGFLEHARKLPRRARNHTRERRADNIREVRNTVRRLVNANYASYGYEPVFLTFTFAENRTDIDSAWKDWEIFMRKMRYRFGKLHALSVMEFQSRGAVHFHCIFFNLSPEIEKQERKTREIAQLWGHGFVDIERVRSARNVGAYVCKYLNKSVTDERLIGKKFFSTTKNLIRPKLSTGEFAKHKMMRILEAGEVELLAETEYLYGGEPVIYRNYKLINKELCSKSKTAKF